MLGSQIVHSSLSPSYFDMASKLEPKEGSRRGRGGPFEKAGKVIRALRAERGWSQEDLASAYGSTQGYISSVERGWQPITTASAEWYERMSQALKVDMRELMQALEVDFVVSRGAASSNPTIAIDSETIPPLANLDTVSYVRFITQGIYIGGESDDVLKEDLDFFIPQTLLTRRANSLAIGFVVHSHVDSIPNNVKVLFDTDIEPKNDEVIVFLVNNVHYMGYFSASDKSIVTDRPISDDHAKRLSLSSVKLLGVVENYQALDRPVRRHN